MAENKDKIRYAEDLEGGSYMTLKEAAEFTNYSPDYIGQLIRAGKIEGHQVYTNISWVTTEKALRAYMASKGKEMLVDEKLKQANRMDAYMRYTLYAVIGILIVILAVFLYVFIVGVDRAVTDTYSKDFDPREYGY